MKESFNPVDEQYKKVEDLPEDQRGKFEPVPKEQGGGFVKKEAVETFKNFDEEMVRESADRMNKKIESGEAKNKEEASDLVALENIQKSLKDFEYLSGPGGRKALYREFQKMGHDYRPLLTRLKWEGLDYSEYSYDTLKKLFPNGVNTSAEVFDEAKNNAIKNKDKQRDTLSEQEKLLSEQEQDEERDRINDEVSTLAARYSKNRLEYSLHSLSFEKGIEVIEKNKNSFSQDQNKDKDKERIIISGWEVFARIIFKKIENLEQLSRFLELGSFGQPIAKKIAELAPSSTDLEHFIESTEGYDFKDFGYLDDDNNFHWKHVIFSSLDEKYKKDSEIILRDAELEELLDSMVEPGMIAQKRFGAFGPRTNGVTEFEDVKELGNMHKISDAMILMTQILKDGAHIDEFSEKMGEIKSAMDKADWGHFQDRFTNTVRERYEKLIELLENQDK